MSARAHDASRRCLVEIDHYGFRECIAVPRSDIDYDLEECVDGTMRITFSVAGINLFKNVPEGFGGAESQFLYVLIDPRATGSAQIVAFAEESHFEEDAVGVVHPLFDWHDSRLKGWLPQT